MKNLKQDYQDYKSNYEYSPEELKYNIFRYVFDKINEGIISFKCRKGHKWEVQSDIGPNSGSEELTCTCCGVSQTNIYY